MSATAQIIYTMSSVHFWKEAGMMRGPRSSTWVHRVIEISPFIHPDLGYSSRIVQHNFGNTTREGIGGLITKHVTDMGTRDDFQNTATLPNLRT